MPRALLDYHHADLIESLHLLFEDRLGIECYIPVGLGWWDYGVWGFGKGTYNDNRLAQQFLTRETVEVDTAHPERRHRCVTLEEASEMTWDYVVASVPDNYIGYSRFAKEHGAKFVIQAGNTRQPIDWGLDPLVISTSESPIRGKGVTVHQEFAVPEPSRGDPRVIASFANCMDRLPCYPQLQQARELLPDFHFLIHGIDGEHGNIKPTSAVTAIMQASGWGWHDKITGDGFGHVIHGWAAVGRPLVGHRGHYVGQMAEELWIDGYTCIDLDKHGVIEATALIRDIAAEPERHQIMCDAIRSRFLKLVDYEAEAEQVRALLA